MALIEPFMVKTVEPGAADAIAEVIAETGQSIMIKKLGVLAALDSEFVEALIGRLSVGYFRIGLAADENHLQIDSDKSPFENLHDYLVTNGIFRGYPVAEGETFTLKNVTATSVFQGHVIYEIHDAGDITKDLPNGSEATEFDFIHYGTNDAGISTSTYGDIDLSLNPKEYPSFPFGVDVPAGKEIDIHGILLKNWGGRVDDTATNMERLRLSKDRKVLFDEDRVGMFIEANSSYLTYHTANGLGKFVAFPTPITFRPGEELKIEIKCGATLAITAKDVVLGLVETVRTVV